MGTIDHLHLVAIAGGSGTRFWPLSRRHLPKQLLTLGGEHTLLRATFERCAELAPAERWWMVVGEGHAQACAEAVPAVAPERVLSEPIGRNTAPAIALAAVHLRAADPQATMVVLPADHHVANSKAFVQSLRLAAKLAARGGIVTLGIEPTYAETGYGYIQRGVPAAEGHAFRVARFCEKPDHQTAESFLASGNYDWNAGIFVMKVSTFLDELRRQLPEMAGAFAQLSEHLGQPSYRQALQHTYQQVDSVSVDYGIMEGAKEVWVVPTRAGWNDVGSLRSLQALGYPDAEGNVVTGPALALDSTGCIVHTHAGQRVVLLGVAGLVVVSTPDAILVVPKDKAQEVRQVVAELAEQGHTEIL